MENIYVLKDQDGNFVASHSISYNASTKKVCYAYSKFLTGGFYYQATRKGTEADLDKLNQMQARFQLSGKSFHVEEINRREVLFKEYELGVPTEPFQHEYFDFNDNKHYLWVIRNSKNNFVHAKSIRKCDTKNWVYSSYKTFSPECRGYVDLYKAETAMDKLCIQAQKMGLDEQFRLEYIALNALLEQPIAFKGDNMVLLEKQVS